MPHRRQTAHNRNLQYQWGGKGTRTVKGREAGNELAKVRGREPVKGQGVVKDRGAVKDRWAVKDRGAANDRASTTGRGIATDRGIAGYMTGGMAEVWQ